MVKVISEEMVKKDLGFDDLKAKFVTQIINGEIRGDVVDVLEESRQLEAEKPRKKRMVENGNLS